MNAKVNPTLIPNIGPPSAEAEVNYEGEISLTSLILLSLRRIYHVNSIKSSKVPSSDLDNNIIPRENILNDEKTTSKIIVLLLSLAAIVVADSREIYRPPQSSQETSESSEESYESSEAKYSFNWAVSDDSSSNEFGHQEARDGDHTQGSYYVQLPDGRLQTVTYFVDGDSGYVAEVNYKGEISDESNSSESEEDTAEYDS
ncbi:uncharacterized protein LOC119596651 [Penaeus monodon]|uniref:uncharacterized protein LOC119596651 n=1 Tax=Penaeus monodon TaxID=6687 RepID=UPI0018A7D5A3|nr:uncharacterized protein LOC119596651 [Penaeus monodon]